MCDDDLKLCGDCKFFNSENYIPGYEWYKLCTEGLPMYVLSVAPACKLFEERSNMANCPSCMFFDFGFCSKYSKEVHPPFGSDQCAGYVKSCLGEPDKIEEDYDDFFDDDEEDVSDQFVVPENLQHTSDRVTLNDAHYIELSKKAKAMDYFEQYAMASQFHSDVLFEILSDRIRTYESKTKEMLDILDGFRKE